jgi:hypothetical protein
LTWTKIQPEKIILVFKNSNSSATRCAALLLDLDFSPKVSWTKAEKYIEHVGANLKGPRSAVNRTNLPSGESSQELGSHLALEQPTPSQKILTSHRERGFELWVPARVAIWCPINKGSIDFLFLDYKP